MHCFKCGKEIADNSYICQHCGAQLGKSKSSHKKVVVAGVIAGIVVLAGLGAYKMPEWYKQYKKYKQYKIYQEQNPVLNSENRERSYMTETALLRNLTYIKIYKNSVI